MIGSGTNWIAHLIELATGIYTNIHPKVSNGSYILIFDHFLDIYRDKDENLIIDIRLFRESQ